MKIYESHRDEPILDWQWQEPSLRNLTELVLARLPAPPARVLDVGCGSGRVTFAMDRRGYAVDAVDVEPRVVALANRILEGRACRARATVADFCDPRAARPSRYDAVVCSEVIEHVVDYRTMLANIHQSLVPGGRLVLTVPHDAAQFSEIDRYNEHLRRLSVAELRRDLAMFSRVETRVVGFPFHRLLVWLYLSSLRIRGRRHSNETLWSRPWARWSARAVYPLLRADNLLSQGELGTTIVATATR